MQPSPGRALSPCYARAHFYWGAAMLAVLLVATTLFTPPADVLQFVWFMFVLAFALLAAPVSALRAPKDKPNIIMLVSVA